MMMVALLSVTFVACSDDDDDDDSSSGSSVVGTWSGSWSYSDESETITLTFKSNGTGTYVDVYKDSYGTEKETGTFTYKMEGQSKGIITLKYYDSYSYSGYVTDYLYFEIKGKKMYLYEDGYDDEDMGMVLTKQ